MNAAGTTLRTVVLVAWLAGAGLISSGTPGQSASAEFPLPFSTAVGIAVSDDIAVCLFASALGNHVLAGFRLSDGTQVVRVDDVDADVWAFNGRHVLFRKSSEAALSIMDVRSETVRSMPITGEALAGHRPLLTSELAWLAVRLDGGIQIRGIPTGASDVAEIQSPALDVTAQRVLVGDGAAVVCKPDASGCLAWTAGSDWRAIDVTARQVLAISGRRLLAVDSTGKTLRAVDLDARLSSEWSVLYEKAGSPIDEQWVRPDPVSGDVIVVERDSLVAWFARQVPGQSGVPAKRWRLGPAFDGADAGWIWNGGKLIQLARRDNRLWLTVTAPPLEGSGETASPPRPGGAGLSGDHAAVSDSAIQWLRGQRGEPLTTARGTARLVDSYADDRRAGWIYDAAMASIAFSAWRHHDDARELLAGLEMLQQPDGSWFFAYDPDTGQPAGTKKYIGSMAWVIIAANFYRWETKRDDFDAMVAKGLRYIDRFQETDVGRRAAGGVSMGPDDRSTYSAEHNADAYAAYIWSGTLASRPEHLQTADRIRAFIERELWNDTGRGGFFKVGLQEGDLYLDAQTWTLLALLPRQSDRSRIRSALETAERRLKVTEGRWGPLRDIIGFKSNEAGAPVVWSEGSEGMVAALQALGETTRARLYHAQTLRYQDRTGGVPYATENDGTWSRSPSVAGTAWFLVNRTWPPRNPFHPDLESWLREFGSSPRLLQQPD